MMNNQFPGCGAVQTGVFTTPNETTVINIKDNLYMTNILKLNGTHTFMLYNADLNRVGSENGTSMYNIIIK